MFKPVGSVDHVGKVVFFIKRRFALSTIWSIVFFLIFAKDKSSWNNFAMSVMLCVFKQFARLEVRSVTAVLSHPSRLRRTRAVRRLTENHKYRFAKKASMVRLWFTLLAITLCALVLSACDTETALVTQIIVDFPHGALRLLVQRDGDTRLFYGELPTYRTVQGNTFNIDDLFQQLQPRLHDNVPAENRPLGQPYGMATIEFSDGSGQDYLIYDETFAVELFRAACANLVEDKEFSEEIVTAECAKIGSAAP